MFRRNEIESLQVLSNRRYWVKSHNYPVDIITIENWIRVCERLQILSRNLSFTRKDRMLRASKDIATGIMQCGECGVKFYYQEQKKGITKAGEVSIYRCYYHLAVIKGTLCGQRPRSFKLNDINEIFKTFYFFYLLVFDNRNELTEASQRSMRQSQMKLKEKIAKAEKEIPLIERRILKMRSAMEKLPDEDLMVIMVRQIRENESKLESMNTELAKLKIDYEVQNERLNQAQYEATYYDVKDKINDWFYNHNVEEQRNELIRVVEKCTIYNHHLIIDTGKILFLFDIKQRYVFDMQLLENLNKDEVYKSHFVKMQNKRQAKRFNDKRIAEINLNLKSETKIRVFEYMVRNLGIAYNLIGKTKLISFVPFVGYHTMEIKMPD